MRNRILIALILAVAAPAALWLIRRTGEPVAESSLTPSPASPSQPTAPDASVNAAHWVGSAACAACHQEQFDSFRETAHNHAMSVVDVDQEPPDGVFDHPLSGRTYRVERRDGQMWHSEHLLTDTVNTTTSTDQQLTQALPGVKEPVRYLVGSGRHSRTYLVEKDGFLSESPITWYTSTGKWALSPGYDAPFHAGFERATDQTCLICHLGQADPVENSVGRAELRELAIGCERCHGPGSRHVEVMQTATSKPGTVRPDDLWITHPGRLERSLLDSVCAQCHLRGDATVVVRGRALEDFHPGMALSTVRMDYHLATGHGEMKVVGHTEQMKASLCYQQSSTLSCITCHDPHRQLSHEDQVAFVRDACLTCHQPEACGLEHTERIVRQPDDNCAACHMPQVPTDIPHIAFTHHRIGIHSDRTVPRSDPGPGRLVPFSAPAEMSEFDQNRNLGLAYAELSYRQSDRQHAEVYRREAIRLLTSTSKDSRADGDLLAALARFAWEENDLTAATSLARRASQDRSIPPGAYLNSLYILGSCSLETGQPKDAIGHLTQLTGLRRNSEDWWLLGVSQMQLRDFPSAIRTLEHAVSIQPFRPDLHATLADALDAAGIRERASVERKLAQRLRQNPQPQVSE
ncbi:MAG: hypothetical protein KDA96_14340 [Planctomycetaceae bacterium]|nr:hypothetical protein [Planctomycetaceae bacterium]